MNKLLVILTIGIALSIANFANAGILIGNDSDPVREKIICKNGDKLINYEARVLVAGAKHVSGIDSLDEKKEKVVVKEVCNCDCKEEEGITIDVTYSDSWSY